MINLKLQDMWEIQSLFVAYKSLSIVTFIVLLMSITILLLYFVSVRRRANANGETQREMRAKYKSLFANIFLMGLVGGLAGHLGGSSREGVVGELIPAVFTLFGGYLAYYLGEKRDAKAKIAINTISFLLCFFTVYNVAAIWRQNNENWTFCRELYSNPAFSTADQRADRNATWNSFCQPVFNAWTKTP